MKIVVIDVEKVEEFNGYHRGDGSGDCSGYGTLGKDGLGNGNGINDLRIYDYEVNKI